MMNWTSFLIVFMVAAAISLFTALWKNRLIYMSAYSRLLAAVEFIQEETITSPELLNGIRLRLITAEVVEFAKQEDAVFKAAKKRFRLLSKIFKLALVVILLLAAYLLFDSPWMFLWSQPLTILCGVMMFFQVKKSWIRADPFLNVLSGYVETVAVPKQVDEKFFHPCFIGNLEKITARFKEVMGTASKDMLLASIGSLLIALSWAVAFFEYGWYGTG